MNTESGSLFCYVDKMNQKDGKKILWENVSALMVLRYGKENLTKLAADAKVGPATMTRVKEQKTSIGTDKLDQIAQALRVQAWQLLVPGLDVKTVMRPVQNRPTAHVEAAQQAANTEAPLLSPDALTLAASIDLLQPGKKRLIILSECLHLISDGLLAERPTSERVPVDAIETSAEQSRT